MLIWIVSFSCAWANSMSPGWLQRIESSLKLSSRTETLQMLDEMETSPNELSIKSQLRAKIESVFFTTAGLANFEYSKVNFRNSLNELETLFLQTPVSDQDNSAYLKLMYLRYLREGKCETGRLFFERLKKVSPNNTESRNFEIFEAYCLKNKEFFTNDPEDLADIQYLMSYLRLVNPKFHIQPDFQVSHQEYPYFWKARAKGLDPESEEAQFFMKKYHDLCDTGMAYEIVAKDPYACTD